MKNNPNTVNSPTVLPRISGAFCLLVFVLIGLAAPVFHEMYDGFFIQDPPINIRILSSIHLYWTLPLGGILAIILFVGPKRWTRKTNIIVDAAAIAATIAIACTVIYMAYLPIFVMSS